MPLPVSDIVTVFQHLQTLANDPERYRPARCDHCGCAGLWRHGCYMRKPRCREATAALNPIPIPRFLCRVCRRTCSTLACGLSPRRCYDWALQQVALIAALAGLGDERSAELAGVHPSTVARWRRWLQNRHTPFAAALRVHWPTLGYAGDWADFWRRCFDEWGLAGAMRRLLFDGFTVP